MTPLDRPPPGTHAFFDDASVEPLEKLKSLILMSLSPTFGALGLDLVKLSVVTSRNGERLELPIFEGLSDAWQLIVLATARELTAIHAAGKAPWLDAWFAHVESTRTNEGA